MANLKIEYPSYIETAVCRILNAGKEVFLVGGALRDKLLGKECNDFDLATSALPEETAEIFKDLHCIKTGMKHGTVTVIIEGKPIEITTFRKDGEYKDNRHPDGVFFTPDIKFDLSRRDFTINAMAYNHETGLIDLFGGENDLKNGIIRAVGEPKRRFNEDALRIMRAFRFSSKLDFDIEDETLLATKECRDGLRSISAERKTAELEGILLGTGAKKALTLMAEVGIFEIIAEGITIDKEKLSKINELPIDFATRLAFIFGGSDDLADKLSKMRLSNAVKNKILKLDRLASEPICTDTDGDIRRLISRCGDDIFDLLYIKNALGENTRGLEEKIKAIQKRGDCLSLKSLAIGGKDLLELGITPSLIGEILEYLLSRTMDDPTLNEKGTLIALAKQKTQ